MIGSQSPDVQELRLGVGPLRCTVISAEISLAAGEHDTVRLRLTDTTDVSYWTAMGSLLYFQFGGLGRFYGYVTDVTYDSPTQQYRNVVKIQAMGPTLLLKSGRPRFYTDVTVADVISRIAGEHQLGFSDEYGEKHHVWRQLAQTDESDWAFVTALTDRVGAALVCCYGVLRLINPRNVLSRSAPMMYYSSSNDGTADIYDMVPAHYSDRLPTQHAPTVGYLSGGKAVVIPGTGAPNVPRHFSADRPLLSAKEAELAQTRMPVDWSEQATARLQGGALIEPGSVLLMKQSGQMTKRVAYDGYWYVMEVTHNLAPGVFQSVVNLARITKVPRMLPVSPKQWFFDPRGRPQMRMTAISTWASTWR